MTKFPTLYSRGSKGEIRIWEIVAEGDSYTMTHGVKGGKLVSKTIKCKGKNAGKANATTDEEQTVKEAQAKWEKQLKRSYFQSEEDALNSIDFTPMKLQNFSDQGHKIHYPCFYSLKVDGLRLMVDKEFKAQSKAGEDYTIPTHIMKDLRVLYDALGKENWYGLDGEVYAGHKDRGGLSLQEIVSAFRKQNPNTERLQYWIYDIPKAGEPFSTRNERLGVIQDIIRVRNLRSLVALPCSFAFSEKDIQEKFEKAVKDKEEGLVVRNANGLYEFGKRSYDAQKIKHRETTEAYVYGAEEDKNNEAVLHARLQNGIEFKVKMRKDASDECNLRLYENHGKLVGKFIEVEYEDKSLDGVPTKPVGLRIREVNPETWEPKE